MTTPVLKAFVLCTKITDTPGETGQKDLRGAGLRVVRNSGYFPFKFSFWAYLEISDQRSKGDIRFAFLRADSGRRHFFPTISVTPEGPLQSLRLGIGIFDCTLPDPGVYFVEVWYDGIWLLDQRLEVVDVKGE